MGNNSKKSFTKYSAKEKIFDSWKPLYSEGDYELREQIKALNVISENYVLQVRPLIAQGKKYEL